MPLPETVRKQRLRHIVSYIGENAEREGEIVLDRLIAWVCWNYGCTEKTAKDYLSILRKGGLIEIDGTEVRFSTQGIEP